MRGLDSRIHQRRRGSYSERWIAGSSPALTGQTWHECLVKDRIENDPFLPARCGLRLLLLRGRIEQAERIGGGPRRLRSGAGLRRRNGSGRRQVEAGLAAAAAERKQQRCGAKQSQFRRARTVEACHADVPKCTLIVPNLGQTGEGPVHPPAQIITLKSRLFAGVSARLKPARGHWPALSRQS